MHAVDDVLAQAEVLAHGPVALDQRPHGVQVARDDVAGAVVVRVEVDAALGAAERDVAAVRVVVEALLERHAPGQAPDFEERAAAAHPQAAAGDAADQPVDHQVTAAPGDRVGPRHLEQGGFGHRRASRPISFASACSTHRAQSAAVTVPSRATICTASPSSKRGQPPGGAVRIRAPELAGADAFGDQRDNGVPPPQVQPLQHGPQLGCPAWPPRPLRSTAASRWRGWSGRRAPARHAGGAPTGPPRSSSSRRVARFFSAAWRNASMMSASRVPKW